jgi:hypothetical protein
MNDLPDAPWIREAEMYGLPEAPAPICPCCGQECDTYYYTWDEGIRGDVVGCENCIRAEDAYNN